MEAISFNWLLLFLRQYKSACCKKCKFIERSLEKEKESMYNEMESTRSMIERIDSVEFRYIWLSRYVESAVFYILCYFNCALLIINRFASSLF